VLGIFYGVHVAAFCYALMVGRELAGMPPISPGWVSVRVLAWLSAATAATASLLMWLNVTGFELTLGETAGRRMTAGAFATGATAVVLLGLAGAHYSFGRRGSRVGAALLAITVFGSLALPIAARGPAVRPAVATPPTAIPPARTVSGPRVVMILLDGGSLEYVWPRAASGRFPNFARLIDTGASLDLATIRPTSPDPVWSAVATGMYPDTNGVRSPSRYVVRGDTRHLSLLPDHCFSHVLVRLGFVSREPNSSDTFRTRPLWSILAQAGISSGVVRWPLTYPAPTVHGFVLSDHFHQQLGSLLELDSRAAQPPEAIAIARRAFLDDGEMSDQPSPAAAQEGATTPASSAAARDAFYARAMRDLSAAWPVQLSAIRYQGLDTVGHHTFRYAQPRDVGDPGEEERRRRLMVMDRYYAYVDSQIGTALASLLPGDLLLVISGFGMESPSMVKRLIARVAGDPMSGTHERAPDGFLLAFGSAVEPGRHQRGSIVDVTPTVLYFLGLPVGRDMDGYARADLFRKTFTAGRPIAFVPTHN
jgi:predicted AlkP superfamily phosphohydrolase/phosphomutase